MLMRRYVASRYDIMLPSNKPSCDVTITLYFSSQMFKMGQFKYLLANFSHSVSNCTKYPPCARNSGAENLIKSPLSDDTDQLTDSHVIPNDKSQEFMLSPNSEDSHLSEADSGRSPLRVYSHQVVAVAAQKDILFISKGLFTPSFSFSALTTL